MYTYDFPRPAVTVDIIIFTLRESKLQVLLVQRAQPPYQDAWALPGGFVQLDESLEEAAARELEEETGVQEAYLEQLYTYGEPDRDPRGRVITVAYYALLPRDAPIRQEGGSDARKARLFSINELPGLAFD
jgi:8-oxo-dGTP diphosphatase